MIGQDAWFKTALKRFGTLLGVFAALTLYANWYWWTGDNSMGAFIPPFVSGFHMTGQAHLGGEYYNIARAIFEGRGFSDPFGDSTGPTGWSPPVLTYLMAGVLHLVDGSKEALVKCFFAMQAAVLAVTTTILLFVAERLRPRGGSGLPLLAAAVVIAPNFRWIFQVTHDCVFQMLLVDLIVVGLWAWRVPPAGTGKRLAWGGFGGTCALCSPIVGFTWACATVGTWRLGNWRAIGLAAANSVVVVAPWILVQTNRLGVLVPIKSNASFEQFQGQLVLPDGLVVESSYALHPYKNGSAEGKRYREVGEVLYLHEKREQFRAAVRDDPREYARRTGRRLLAATVWHDTDIPAFRAKPGFMIVRLWGVLPFLGFVMILMRPARRAPWVTPAIWCFGVYLAPYVLIGYYERYAVPLTLPRMIFTLWLLGSLTDAWQSRAIRRGAQTLLLSQEPPP